MNYTDVQWDSAYQAYLKSHLSKAEFYYSAFERFCPSHLPALSTFYAHFRRLDKVGEAPAETPAVESGIKTVASTKTTTGSEVRVVHLSSEDIARGLQACDEEVRHDQAQRFTAAQAPLRPFRVQLPNGTRLEFDSVAPEALALRMVCFAGGAA